MDGEEPFRCKEVNGGGVAVSSRDRCGALRAVSASEVDGFAVMGEGLLCGELPASVVRDVNGLRAEVAGLWKDILQMKSLHAGLEAGSSRKPKSDTCYIYVRLSGMGDTPIGKGCLESILKCQILQYSCIWASHTPSFKVKILKDALHDALFAGRSAGCLVDLWRKVDGGRARCCEVENKMETRTEVPGGVGLQISCWNCRGLSNSGPYLEQLINNGPKVMVILEHWLWPFELHRLGEVHPDFDGVGVADRRLHENRDAGRGCGGVGVIWHKSLDATPISGIESNRICGIRIRESDGSDSFLMVIGVYLPCLNLGIEYFQEQLVELERVSLESKQMGMVVVLGDFNAHLGSLAGARSQGDPNTRGILVEEILKRYELYVASQSEIVVGPQYTCVNSA